MKLLRRGVTAPALAFSVAVAVCGCATGIKKNADQSYDQAKDMAEQLIAASKEARKPVSGPIITDAPYVDTTPIDKIQREPLVFNRIFSFSTRGAMPLHVFATRVGAMSGLKVRYQPEMISGNPSDITSVQPATGGGPLVVNGIALPSVDATIGAATAPVTKSTDADGQSSPMVTVNFNGPLRALFEQVAEQTGLHWRWDAARQQVDFFRYETEAFRIAAVPGTSKSRFELGSTQQSDADTTLRLTDTESSHVTDGATWKEIEDTLSRLVSAKGVFKVNESAGMVLVRDQPANMEAVRDYIGKLNAALSRQVDIEVTVYRVQVNDRDFKGVSWDGIFQSLINTSRYNIAWSTVRPDVVTESASSAVIRIPESNGGVPNRYGNTQLFLDALSTLGRTSVVQSTNLLATNNRAAAAKFVKRTTYLAETVPTYINGGGNQVGTGAGLTPGSIETGLHLYLLPNVQDDGKRLLLRAMVSVSTLDAMETGSSGESNIQLPQMSAREFAQEAWLKSGETLVLTGFNQTEAGNTSRSPFGRWWGLGGERTVSHGRELLVVALTPVVTAARSRI